MKLTQPFQLYRGQKSWSDAMAILAPSLRNNFGQDPTVLTDQLLLLIDGLVSRTEAGDAQARSYLENKLLYLQQSKYENPYVSCSHEWSVAQSFALQKNTPGYVLTISGDPSEGLDFESLRSCHGLFGDSMTYLSEFGIPRRLKPPFTVDRVDLVTPFGQPTVRVIP
jgi:hypothetical protein